MRTGIISTGSIIVSSKFSLFQGAPHYIIPLPLIVLSFILSNSELCLIVNSTGLISISGGLINISERVEDRVLRTKGRIVSLGKVNLQTERHYSHLLVLGEIKEYK